MIEEMGHVIQVKGSSAWVETERTSTCSACVAKSGCGTAVLSKILGGRRNRVWVVDPLGVKAGDHIVIGLQEEALVRGSFAVYATPLLGLLLGALLGHGVGGTQSASILLSVLGFCVGLVWLRRFSQHINSDARYQPLVLRKVDEVVAPSWV